MVEVNEVRNKIWKSIRYNTHTTNCGNCEFADPGKWYFNKGECTVLSRLPFIILKEGICKLHSDLR